MNTTKHATLATGLSIAGMATFAFLADWLPEIATKSFLVLGGAVKGIGFALCSVSILLKHMTDNKKPAVRFLWGTASIIALATVAFTIIHFWNELNGWSLWLIISVLVVGGLFAIRDAKQVVQGKTA